MGGRDAPQIPCIGSPIRYNTCAGGRDSLPCRVWTLKHDIAVGTFFFGCTMWMSCCARKMDNGKSPGMNNLFSNIPADLPEEVVETLLETKSLRIERIVSHGHTSAKDFWYDQHQHEWVLLLQGEAKLQFEDDTELLSMKPGDCVNIPAGRRHRVEWTTPSEPTMWLVILYAAETE